MHSDIHSNQVCSLFYQNDMMVSAGTDNTIAWHKVTPDRLVDTVEKICIPAKINMVAAGVP